MALTFKKELAWRWEHICYVAGSLRYLLKPTPTRVRRYFEHGRHTTWTTIKATPWRESPNDTCYHSAIVGIANDGEMFQANMTVSDLEVVSQKSPWAASELTSSKMKQGLAYINTFLDPACRCKAGPHWICSVHHTWYS